MNLIRDDKPPVNPYHNIWVDDSSFPWTWKYFGQNGWEIIFGSGSGLTGDYLKISSPVVQWLKTDYGLNPGYSMLLKDDMNNVYNGISIKEKPSLDITEAQPDYYFLRDLSTIFFNTNSKPFLPDGTKGSFIAYTTDWSASITIQAGGYTNGTFIELNVNDPSNGISFFETIYAEPSFDGLPSGWRIPYGEFFTSNKFKEVVITHSDLYYLNYWGQIPDFSGAIFLEKSTSINIGDTAFQLTLNTDSSNDGRVAVFTPSGKRNLAYADELEQYLKLKSLDTQLVESSFAIGNTNAMYIEHFADTNLSYAVRRFDYPPTNIWSAFSSSPIIYINKLYAPDVFTTGGYSFQTIWPNGTLETIISCVDNPNYYILINNAPGGNGTSLLNRSVSINVNMNGEWLIANGAMYGSGLWWDLGGIMRFQVTKDDLGLFLNGTNSSAEKYFKGISFSNLVDAINIGADDVPVVLRHSLNNTLTNSVPAIDKHIPVIINDRSNVKTVENMAYMSDIKALSDRITALGG